MELSYDHEQEPSLTIEDLLDAAGEQGLNKSLIDRKSKSR